MDKQNLMPQAAQPVNRITTGQLPAELAELSEEALQLHGGVDGLSVLPSLGAAGAAGAGGNYDPYLICIPQCSYDGDDAE